MKEVPGLLGLPSAVTRGYAYEVLIDDQQVALGSVPDVGSPAHSRTAMSLDAGQALFR